MRLFDRHIEIPGLSKDQPIIGVNWAGDRPRERFSEPWEHTRNYFIDTLRNALIKMVKTENIGEVVKYENTPQLARVMESMATNKSLREI